MKLAAPIEQYLTGDKPSHTSRARLATHITFWPQDKVEELLREERYLTPDGKISPRALSEGLVDTCDGKPLWNLKKTKLALLAATRKTPKENKTPAKPIVMPRSRPTTSGPVWTDLENIGTYFGVGKNKVGTWLDQLGLRGNKELQVNESGDYDMLDVARQSQEKFSSKVPTEKALNEGYAQVEVVEYRGKGGKEKSFEKYSWDRDRVKDLLVRAGHPLDTERKLLLKGKGKNSNVSVDSLDTRAEALHAEWKKLYADPATRKASWKVFDRKPSALLMRVEMLMGKPRYLRDKQYMFER